MTMTMMDPAVDVVVETEGEAPVPTAGARKPTLMIRPSSGWSALNLTEVWHFRDLMLTLAGRDIKLRYKQTALGMIWVILQPLMAAGIFTVVFSKIAKLSSDGVPYFLFAFVGQLGWNLFNGTVSKASGSLVGNSNLISKVFFPRLVLPLSGIPSTLLDFGVAAMMLVGLMIYFHMTGDASARLHTTPGWPMLLVPVWMALLLLMSMGIGLVTAGLTVTYRDVQYIMPVVLSLMMYASPVAYGASNVPESIKPFFYLNPMTPLLEGFRWSLLNTDAPDWRYVGFSAAAALVVMAWGAFSFKRMERRFADVV
jgi:lipopolysaccharide transport system permease protein